MVRIRQLADSKRSSASYFVANYQYYIMLLPCIAFFLLFKYGPMYGVILAFKDFSFRKGILGSEWVGFANFEYMFQLGTFYRVFANSLILSLLRIVFCFPVPIVLALMLNEMKNQGYKRISQTIIYLPHFISWVVVGGMLINFLSPTWGVVNLLIKELGGEPIFFLGSDKWFRPIVVLSDIWKSAGWDAILYIAALAGVQPELYEAAQIDGANRMQRIWHITLPGIRSTIVTLFILRIGGLLANGFEQIYMLQNGNNHMVSEVFETYSYSMGLLSGNYSLATTVGLFQSVISFIFLIGTNFLAHRIGEEGIW